MRTGTRRAARSPQAEPASAGPSVRHASIVFAGMAPTTLARIGAQSVARAPASLAHAGFGDHGPHVVLLHGIPGSRASFERVATALGQHCRVLVPDLLGFGDSPDAPAGAHAQLHAEAVSRWLQDCGVERLHLVGFDFGGPTAILLAARLRGRVQSLTLAATNLFPDTPVPLPLRVAKVPGLGALCFRLALGRLGLLAMWRAAVADRAAFPLSRYRAMLRDNCVRSTRRIFYASMRDLPGLYGEIARTAQTLQLPAAVLWGDRDPFFPLAVGERTARTLGAPLHVLTGCGHFVPEERPAEMARVIAALVERAAPG